MAPKRSNDQKEEEDKKSNGTGRVIAILSAEGYTGSAVIELLYSDGKYSDKFDKVIGITFGEPTSSDVKAIHEEYSVETVSIEDVDADYLKSNKIDTALVIPPARKDKVEVVKQFLEKAKEAKSVKNVVLLSSVGCDYATEEKQPRLREFVELEVLAMQPKSDSSTEDTGHSPCIVRAGFYLENLLVYSKQAQSEGKLPLPIDEDHKFAPVALGDVAQLLAYIVTSQGEQGLGDEVRGQLIVLTGPLMTAGPELAEAASQGLSTKLEFQSIKENEAKTVLKGPQGEELDDAEIEYLLEYYSLVREGKTNYCAGRPVFKQLLGEDLEEPSDWFAAYEGSFTGKNKKRKIAKDDDEDETDGKDEKSAKQKQSEGGKKGGKASGSSSASNKKTVTSSSTSKSNTNKSSDNQGGKVDMSHDAKERQREGGRKGGKTSGKQHGDDDDEVLEDAEDNEEDGDEKEKSAKQKMSEGGKKGGKASGPSSSTTKKASTSSNNNNNKSDHQGDKVDMSDDAKERQREGGRKGGKASGKQHSDDDDEVLEDVEEDDGDDEEKSAKQKMSEGGKKGGKASGSSATTKKPSSSSNNNNKSDNQGGKVHMSEDAKERQREGGRKGGKASGRQNGNDDDEVLEDAEDDEEEGDDKEKSAKQKMSEGGKKGGKASGSTSSNKKTVTKSSDKKSPEEVKEAQREGGRKGGKASGSTKKQDDDGDEDLEDADPDAEYVE